MQRAPDAGKSYKGPHVIVVPLKAGVRAKMISLEARRPSPNLPLIEGLSLQHAKCLLASGRP